MNSETIRLKRLHNQHITHMPSTTPEEIIMRLGTIQAQDYQGAIWSIGLRLTNVTAQTIEKTISEKTIIRTWLMRGTLHFAASKDLRWMLDLFAPRVMPTYKRRYAELELDEPTLIKCDKILTDALQQQKVINRTGLLGILEQKGISTKGQRAAHILQHAALHGLICQTNTIKNVPNYISMEEIPKRKKTYVREEALTELAKRYFMSRGPATLQDFVWWSGLTTTDAKTGLENIKAQLQQITIDGQTYWFPDGTAQSKQNQSPIHLLPGFDEFLLGYKVRTASLDSQYNNHWCPGNNGMFMPFIVKDGEVVGLWKRMVKKDKILLETNFFKEKDSILEKHIPQAFNNYCRFMDKKII